MTWPRRGGERGKPTGPRSPPRRGRTEVSPMSRWILTLALVLCAPVAAFAQQPAQAPRPEPAVDRDYIKANYTKYEYRIPMRDGVKLFTAVYVPKDDSQTYPIMLMRTPYSCAPYGVDKYPPS